MTKLSLAGMRPYWAHKRKNPAIYCRVSLKSESRPILKTYLYYGAKGGTLEPHIRKDTNT